MNTGFRQSLSVRLFFGTVGAALLLVPGASLAQAGNTATGVYALYSNTTGYNNTADGNDALFSNTTGFQNTATGNNALADNSTGYDNTATGNTALYYNTTGFFNTAFGAGALPHNTTGNYNSANGTETLYSNINGNENIATGSYALYHNTTGSDNTANGVEALFNNTAGLQNTADGSYALFYTTGSHNIAIGYQAGQNITTGSNNIAIGNQGAMADSGVIRIGTAGTQTAAYIIGVNGVTVSGGVAVYINANGQLGTLTSSRRFKNDITAMGDVSEKLMNLRPVTFRYNDAAERGTHALQYGLIAEEVAKVYPNLVQYDKAGKPFTVYYHLLIPMLLNELQKDHRRTEAQKAEIAAQNTEIVALKAALQKQSSDLTLLKQTQQQQTRVLAKLAAFVQTSQTRESLQNTVFVQR